MRRFMLVGALATAFALAATACGGDGGGDASGGDRPFEGRTLRVAAWSGPYARSIREYFVPPFEEATGATVEILDEWTEQVDKILAAPADQPPFDLSIGEGYLMCYGLQNDVWLEVDYSKISRAGEIYPWYREADEIDCEDDAYGVPFGYGYSVLGFRESDLGFRPTSWEDLWRAEAQGKIALDQAFFNYGLAPAAQVQGIDPAALEAGPEMDAVMAKTAELDVTLWYTAEAQVVNAFQTGDVAIAQMYIEGAQQLAEEDPGFDFIIPEEGSMGWIDYYMIVRGTTEVDLAHAFIDHLLDPDLQSRFAEDHLYWMANQDAAIPERRAELFPKTNEELAERAHMFDYDVWIPHYFDETGVYTRFSTEVLGA